MTNIFPVNTRSLFFHLQSKNPFLYFFLNLPHSHLLHTESSHTHKNCSPLLDLCSLFSCYLTASLILQESSWLACWVISGLLTFLAFSSPFPSCPWESLFSFVTLNVIWKMLNLCLCFYPHLELWIDLKFRILTSELDDIPKQCLRFLSRPMSSYSCSIFGNIINTHSDVYAKNLVVWLVFLHLVKLTCPSLVFANALHSRVITKAGLERVTFCNSCNSSVTGN